MNHGTCIPVAAMQRKTGTVLVIPEAAPLIAPCSDYVMATSAAIPAKPEEVTAQQRRSTTAVCQEVADRLALGALL